MVEGENVRTLIANHDNDFAISAPFFPRIFLGGVGFSSFCAATSAETRATASYAKKMKLAAAYKNKIVDKRNEERM